MNKVKKTGIAMGVLLLPVFLYLLVSISLKLGTAVPNEYKKSVVKYFPDQSIFNDHLSLVFLMSKANKKKSLERMRWFDQLFDQFDCYQMLVISNDKTFNKREIELNEFSKNVKYLEGIDDGFRSSLLEFVVSESIAIVDEKGELRGVYELEDLKEADRAKTELFILIKNLKECQKSY